MKEEDIQLKFIEAYNLVTSDRERIIQDTTEVMNILADTTQLDEDITSLNDELAVLTELVSKLVKENSKTGLSLDEYNKRYDELTKR